MTFNRSVCLLTLGLATAFAASDAQQPPTLIKLEDGRRIYVMGLRRWTVPMIQDSLGKYSPKDSLQSHACAAVLRYKLGFADASSSTLHMMANQPSIIFVRVREPQDSSRVRYRQVATDTANSKREWLIATNAMTRSPRVFHEAVNEFLHDRPAPDTGAQQVVAFLRSQTSAANRREAIRILRESPNVRDRSIAALILANFPDQQETWAALFDTILETDGMAKGMASQALGVVARKATRAPNWKALAPAVHAILDGTSLFQLSDVVEVLSSRKEIGPQHARAFLAHGGEMLLNHAAIDQPMLARPARALLIKLHGKDLGADIETWRAWIASLT